MGSLKREEDMHTWLKVCVSTCVIRPRGKLLGHVQLGSCDVNCGNSGPAWEWMNLKGKNTYVRICRQETKYVKVLIYLFFLHQHWQNKNLIKILIASINIHTNTGRICVLQSVMVLASLYNRCQGL